LGIGSDRLRQALKTEQENHAQTGKSLTTALGDAIDSLARERVRYTRAGKMPTPQEFYHLYLYLIYLFAKISFIQASSSGDR
jgi:hypothetical protein